MYILNINWFKLKYNYNDDSDNVCDATITDHDQEPSPYSLLPTNEDRQAIITYLLFLVARHTLSRNTQSSFLHDQLSNYRAVHLAHNHPHPRE